MTPSFAVIPEPPRTPDQTRGVERGVNTVLLVVLLFFSAVFLYHALRLVAYPYTVDFGEGYLLNHAGELAGFRNPYRPLDSPPWLVANYPPVFPLLTALGVKLFGLQFHFGRALSLLGVLTTAFCLYRMTRFQTEDRFAALVAGLMWLTAYPVYNWGTHHRVDSTGVALEAVGLLLLLRRDHPRLATVFFLMALYTRQTLWVGPLAGYCYLRRVEGARAANRWFGELLLAGGGIFLLLVAATGGEFHRHLVSYNVNRFYWKDAWVMFHNAVMHFMLVPMALYFRHLLRAIGTGRWDLAACCIPFAFGTFLLVGKVGSATNYLFEMTLVACWVTGLSLAEIRHATPDFHPLRLALPILLVLGALFPTHLPHFYGEWKIFDWGGTPGRSSGDLTETLVNRLKQIPEPIFSQDAGVALLSGHKLVWDPFIMTQLTQEGRFDPAPFHKMIRERQFNALVLPFDTGLGPNAWKDTGWWSQFTEEVAAEIDKAYRVIPASPYDPRMQDPRMRGYFSPFGTNYLYLRR